jgi:hypothetical protein
MPPKCQWKTEEENEQKSMAQGQKKGNVDDAAVNVVAMLKPRPPFSIHNTMHILSEPHPQ